MVFRTGTKTECGCWEADLEIVVRDGGEEQSF